MMTANDSHSLLCGQCYAPLTSATTRDNVRWVACPDCGETETLEGAHKEAAEHKVGIIFNSAFRKIRSSGLPGADKQPQRHYRFVYDHD